MVNQVDYRDPTPNKFPQDYDPAKVDSRVKLRSDSIKHKQMGVDTREAMYQALEIGAVTAGEAKEIATDTANRQDAVDQSQSDFEDRYNDQIAGNTDLNEVIDSRKPEGEPAYKTLGLRLNDMLTISDGLSGVDENIDIGGKLDTIIKGQLEAFVQTLPKDGFKVLMVTDSHYEDLYDESSSFSYPYAKDALEHLATVSYLSQYVNVVVAGGDNVNGLNQDVSHSIADQAQYCAKILQTETDADKFILLGNHDDASTGIRLGKITPDKIVKEDDFKKLFRTGELINDEKRDGDSLYFYKDYPDSKIRLIGLNGLDVPEDKINDDGTLKFTRYLNYSYSQKQIDWLVNEALSSIPEGYQIVVMTHIPLVYDFSPSTETTWANGNILEGLLNAVATGGRYTGKSEDGIPGELQAIVAADFTTQGPRKVAGLWAGHVHTEKITERDNFTQCLFINDCNTNPDYIGTINALGMTIATIDTTTSKVTLSGVGRATDREYVY